MKYETLIYVRYQLFIFINQFMYKILLTFFFLVEGLMSGYTQHSISAIDFVRIKNNKRQEAIYFYENNWKVYRDIALSKGFIKSYKLLLALPDTSVNFDLMLITEYTDSLQLKLSEERFQQIIKDVRPGGPKLLSEIKPNDFRQNVVFKQAETLFTSDKKQ